MNLETERQSRYPDFANIFREKPKEIQADDFSDLLKKLKDFEATHINISPTVKPGRGILDRLRKTYLPFRYEFFTEYKAKISENRIIAFKEIYDEAELEFDKADEESVQRYRQINLLTIRHRIRRIHLSLPEITTAIILPDLKVEEKDYDKFFNQPMFRDMRPFYAASENY